MDDFSEDRRLDRRNVAIAIYLLILVGLQFYAINQAAILGLFSHPVAVQDENGGRTAMNSLMVEERSDPDQPLSETLEQTYEADLTSETDDPDNSPIAEPRDVNSRGKEPSGSVPNAIRNIAFDLGSFSGTDGMPAKPSGGSVEVKKPLFSGGKLLGAIAIAVDGHAQVFVKKAALSGLLSNDASISPKLARLPDGDLISLRSLRDHGINLKYEPISDSILLQP